MSYGLIYTVPFATLDNVPCVVEIEKKDYTGKSKELTPAGDSPFTVDIEDEEFLYTPTRFSTATIRVVGSDYLQSLFSTAYQMYRVTLKVNGLATWCGFIKPELYTQDYVSETFELELECISAMAALEFIDYKQAEENGRVFISLWSLLKKCIASSLGKYNSVCFPYVYAKDSNAYSDGLNILQDMTISEQIFFDEDDKAMTLKEILEEICKLLNWTCVDWRGELYFVDIDHKERYYRYNTDLASEYQIFFPTTIDIQSLGFSGSGHSLDILSGYNKAVIKASNYPIGEIFPEETFNAIVRVVNGYFLPPAQAVTPGIRDEEIILVKQNPTVYKLFEYYLHDSKYLLGAQLYRVCIYTLTRQDDGSYKRSINEFSYDDCIRIITQSQYLTDRTHYEKVKLEANKEMFTFANELPCAAYSGGAFCISGDVAQSNRIDNHYYSSTKGATSSLKLICCLEIGGNYWNGSKWVKTESTFSMSVNPQNTGYTSIENTKTLGMPYKADGYIIELPQNLLTGTIRFTMFTPQVHDSVTAVYIKNFQLSFTKTEDDTETGNSNSDRIYENVVNENYINELEEIEFKITSHNNDGACYSKVIIGDNYLTDNLYSVIEGTTIRPEEHLIRRIIKRYSAPQIKLTQVIKETPDLTPITRLSDNYMVNKRFINVGGTIDYKMNQFQCIMIEV